METTWPVVVRGDGQHRWRYGKVITATMACLGPFAAALAQISGSVPSGAMSFLATSFGVIAVGGLYSYGFCAVWGRTLAPTEYRVFEDRLGAVRGVKVLCSIPRDRIEGFILVGHMDLRRCLLAPGPPPSWPYGLVGLREPRPGELFKAEALPELLIWGRLEAHEVESKIQNALRRTSKLT